MAEAANPTLMSETLPDGVSPIVLATSIVASFVGNNAVRADEIPNLVQATHKAILQAVQGPAPEVEPAALEVEKPTPAQIKNSVTADAIVSFIDGQSYKTLKRHLTAHGLDPKAYRERYGLPVDYPMVAPSYSAARSNLAKQIGLGVPGRMGEQPSQQAQAKAAATSAVRRSKTAA